MIDAFDLDAVGRSPARFDFAKLENLNGHLHPRDAGRDLVQALEDILPEAGPARGAPSPLDDDHARAALSPPCLA